ncbi:MAG: PA14 domain-containing protein [Lentisphaerales bacterium]|nr:PA14 domain-containing protein [Lentisphaerales bacterium]
MNNNLNDTTAKKIALFGRRRRQLIIQKGLFTFITASILAFSVIALLDYFFFMEDWLRYSLSAIVYTGLFITVWITSFKKLMAKTSRRDLARIFEAASPALREKLLSAVELSESDPEKHGSSQAFNDMIQKGISSELSTVDINDVLPKSLVAKRLKTAGLALAICAGLLFVPGIKFHKLMMRAVAPVANIERVSNVKIDIIEPSPADGISARGDAVSIVIQISDPNIKVAWFEYRSNGDKPARISMQKIGDDRFQTSINIGRKNLRYRFRAHTAQTRYYELEALARPQVIEFEKTFNYPKYSLLPAKTIKEQTGNLKALEGTVVDLIMTADQEISEAEITIDYPDSEQKSLKLNIENGKTLKGSLRIDRSATCKVHVTAAKSHFKNSFSPEYEIMALADVLPSISLTQPLHDMTVSRNDIIQIKGLASDDLGIKATYLEYKNNLEDWQRVPLVKGPSKEVMVSHRWDLSALKLASGDEVTFRLLATDLKGNDGMSSSIRLHIVNDGFNPKRFARLNLFKNVYKALDEAAKNTEVNRKMFDEKFNSLINENNENKQKLTALQIDSELNSLEEALREQLETISSQTALAHKKADRNDFDLISNVISHLMNSRYSTVLDKLETTIKDRNQRNHAYHESRGKMHDFNHKIKWTKDLFGRLMAQANSEVFHKDIVQLHYEQKIIEQKQQETDLENIKRRQTNLQKTYAREKKLIKSTKEVAEHGNHHRLDHLVRQIEEVERELNEILIKGPQQSPGAFLAEYFADSKLQIKRLEEKTQCIKLRSNKSPVKGIPEDHWSARLTGKINPEKSSKTEFTLRTDGDVKIWFDGKLVKDYKRDPKKKEIKFHHNLKAGQEVAIKVEYRHYEKSASLSLYWNNGEKKSKQNMHPAKVLGYDYKKVLSRFKNLERDSFHTRKEITQKGQDARRELRRMLEKHVDPIKEAAQAMRELAEAKNSKDENRIEKAEEKVEDKLKQAKEQLADKADLEEKKVDADSEFVEDAAKAAQAISEVEKDMTTDENGKAGKLEKIAKAFDKLEKAHELKELEEEVQEMARKEKELHENEEAKSENNFQQTDEKLKELVTDLQRGDEEDRQTANELNKQIHSHETNDIRNEMNHRNNNPEPKRNVEEQIEKLAKAVSEVRKKQEESVNEARKLLNETAPTIGEQLAELAQEAKDQQEKTGELAENVSEVTVEQNRQEAKALQKDQESLNDKLEDVREALRRQANAQDLTTEEGREKARDADDALAMLDQEPPKAEELLAEASNAENAEEQKEALEQTEQQQQKISEALETLAEHFDENQTPQELTESRGQLRAVETESANIELAQNYEKVETIAEISEQNLDEQIKILENILTQDQEMQKALAEIAQEATEQAAEKLAQAASDEQTIENALAEKPKNDKEAEKTMKKQAGEQKHVTEMTEEASEDLARSQRHQERLGNEQAAQETQQALQSAEQASEKMAQAEQKLNAQEKIQQAQQSAEQAQESAAQAAQQAAQTADSQAEHSPQQSIQQATTPSQQASQQLAQALDQLDQAKAAMTPQAEANQSQNSQAQAQQAMQNAQQALAQAQQAQAQSMVQNRKPADPKSTGDPGQSAGSDTREELAIKLKLKNTDEWGKLPKKIARDIRSARKEKVPEQYQDMVNAYFKVITEQSQNGGDK